MQHLLDIEQLSKTEILDLLDRADAIINSQQFQGTPLHHCQHKTVATLFFENSTRTRLSFELAAKRLSATVVHFDTAHSSIKKGESLLDTILTLQAMYCDIMVIRHHDNRLIYDLAKQVNPRISLINAGCGTRSHPSQALLDLLTIRQHKTHFENLNVAIVGDAQHSRVARSHIKALQKVGVSAIHLISPPALRLEDPLTGIRQFDTFEQGLANVDVILVLRLQKERMQATFAMNETNYFQTYGLTTERMLMAKDDVIVMHPGPINREIDIASEVADGVKSVIQQQVTNGVAVRMAILQRLSENK